MRVGVGEAILTSPQGGGGRAGAGRSGVGGEQRVVDLAEALGDAPDELLVAVGHHAAVIEGGDHEAGVVGVADVDAGLHVGQVERHDAVPRVVAVVGRRDGRHEHVALGDEAARAEDLGVAHEADGRPGADVVDLHRLGQHLGGRLEEELAVAVARHEHVLLGGVADDDQVLHLDHAPVGGGEHVLLDVADEAQVDLDLGARRLAGAVAEEGVELVHVVVREAAVRAVHADDLRRLVARAELEVVAEAGAAAVARELVVVVDAVEEVHVDLAVVGGLDDGDAVAGEHGAGLGVLLAEVLERVEAEGDRDAAAELGGEESGEPVGLAAGVVGLHGSCDAPVISMKQTRLRTIGQAGTLAADK